MKYNSFLNNNVLFENQNLLFKIRLLYFLHSTKKPLLLTYEKSKKKFRL